MKKYIRYGVLLGIILVAAVIVFVAFQKKETKINSESVSLAIYEQELTGEDMEESINSISKFEKNDKFELGDKSNIGQGFTAYFNVNYNKELKNKIKKVTYQIEFTEEANKYCIKHSQVAETPFDNYLRDNNVKEGKSRILIEGIKRSLTEKELLDVLLKCKIILHVEYKNGDTENKTIKFENVKTEINSIDGENPFVTD